MSRPERIDALILGGGLAGLSAAVALRGFGLDVAIVEESLRPGGQIHEIHASIRDYPMAYGLDGARFAAQLLAEARAAGLSILVGSPVTAVSARGRWVERADAPPVDAPPVDAGPKRAAANAGPKRAATDAGPKRGAAARPERLRARTLLIATGLRRRALDVPGESELLGHGVSHSANRDHTLFTGRPVVVVGGGTAAVEDALLCAEVGSEVTLVHRSARFRARTDFLARAREHPRIRIVTNAEVRRIGGVGRVEEVELRSRGSGRIRRIPAAGVFVRIGWDPRTELLRGQIALDRAGYVRVKSGCATSVPGVWAAGDVCSPRCPTLANAAGQGAVAAWEIVRALRRLPE